MVMNAEEPSTTDVEMVAHTKGIRPWLRYQFKAGATGHIGAAARLIGASDAQSIFGRTGIKVQRPGSTKGWHDSLKNVLDNCPDLAAQDRMDVIASLNHWDEIVTAWKVDRAAAQTMAGQKGLGIVASDSLTKEQSSPSAELPVPIEICVMPNCRKTAVYGGERCEHHGGQWLEPDIRQAMLLSTYENLVHASETAVETLMDVMVNSRRDDARVAAAREVLDRVGIRGGTDIHLHVTDEEQTATAVDEIRSRLKEMRLTMDSAAKLDLSAHAAPNRDDDIIDAEVIEEGGDEPEPG